MDKRVFQLGFMVWRAAAAALLVLGLAGCDADGGAAGDAVNDVSADARDAADATDADDRPRAAFELRPGVQSVTVFGAGASTQLTLYGASGERLVSVNTDDLGQAHFAYLPAEYTVLDVTDPEPLSLADGDVIAPGDGYRVSDDSTDPVTWSAPFRVLAIADARAPEFYSQQVLTGLPWSPLSGASGEPADGFQYLEMRDGTLLGAMIRWPDPLLYGDGPWPTVIEYSGYSPSRPDSPDQPSFIANALGFATVSVNMRGSGCSGGVFDVFDAAQQADGYDIVEIVAAQAWALNHKVGMVGLSYPGITQLYVASTAPPSLAAIVPLSVIADAWEMQWPGGIYNKGFTRQWVEEREAASKPGGKAWVQALIDGGDTQCAENLQLSVHSVDFEKFLRSLKTRPDSAADRDLRILVKQIKAAVFLGGQFQDEQTGAQFWELLGSFDKARSVKVLLSNGRHPDGYAPAAVYRWFEFLELYVAERIPVLNTAIRAVGAPEFGKAFGITDASFAPDRWTDYEYDEALALYEAEPMVRVEFESGGDVAEPGAPVARFFETYDAWPPAEMGSMTWQLAPEGKLASGDAGGNGGAGANGTDSADSWRFDLDAGAQSFFGPRGYQLLAPLWDIDWTRFSAGDQVSYLTAPMEADVVLGGPGIMDLWLRTTVAEVDVQVTLTEVRPDGQEALIQNGWLRVGHRAAQEGDGFRLFRSYSAEDYQPLTPGEWTAAAVSIPSVAHAIRQGSRLRVIISAPGRHHGTWEFEAPEWDSAPVVEIGTGGGVQSQLTMGTLDDIDVPESFPACPGLRGQPCRDYMEVANTPAGL